MFFSFVLFTSVLVGFRQPGEPKRGKRRTLPRPRVGLDPRSFSAFPAAVACRSGADSLARPAAVAEGLGKAVAAGRGRATAGAMRAHPRPELHRFGAEPHSKV